MLKVLTERYSFVVATNDRDVLSKNLLASPDIASEKRHELLVLENYSSATEAYNRGLRDSKNEVVIFVHQDVYLPEAWLLSVDQALAEIGRADPNWGLVGCWGVRSDRAKFGHLYTPGDGIIGGALQKPEPVRTLDEVVLILRKSSGLKYDERLAGFHFYGADICLAAAESGRKCYAISAFCIHNSCQYFEYPPEFYAAYRYMKRKWKHVLPIQTSCICVSRFDWDLSKRAVKRALFKATRRPLERGSRVDDPRSLVGEPPRENLQISA